MDPLDLSLHDLDDVGPRDPEQPPEPLGAGGAFDFPTSGSPPFICRRLSPAEWAAYVAAYVWTWKAPATLVLHHTLVPTESSWAGETTMRGMQRFYAGKGWSSAPHIYTAPDGIWLATPMNRIGVHAGTGNGSVAQGWYSIGIEMVGAFDTRLPSGPVWAHTLAVLSGLARKLGVPIAQLLRFHRDYTTQKSCPGRAVTKAWVVAQVEAWLASTAPTQPGTARIPTTSAYWTMRELPVREAPRADAPIAWQGACVLPKGEVVDLTPAALGWMHWAPNGFLPADGVERLTPPAGIYTPLNPILSSPPVDDRKLADAFFARCQQAGSPYAAEAADPIRRVLVPHLVRTCASGRVDPYVAAAQLGHESGWLTSALSQRRDKDGRDLRNGTGIGVNEPKEKATAGWRPGTVWDADVGGYRPAVSFARWEDSIVAQVGRLVAYATKPEERTAEQQALVDAALRFRELPVAFHGSARTLQELGKAHNPMGPAGAGWASPGTDYGQRLAEKARSLWVASR